MSLIIYHFPYNSLIKVDPFSRAAARVVTPKKPSLPRADTTHAPTQSSRQPLNLTPQQGVQPHGVAQAQPHHHLPPLLKRGSLQPWGPESTNCLQNGDRRAKRCRQPCLTSFPHLFSSSAPCLESQELCTSQPSHMAGKATWPVCNIFITRNLSHTLLLRGLLSKLVYDFGNDK